MSADHYTEGDGEGGSGRARGAGDDRGVDEDVLQRVFAALGRR